MQTDKESPADMKTRPMLTLDDCRKISAAAEAEAKKNNWIVAIAILDDGGHLLHLIRMDGASPFNARTAIAKGKTAAETRRSTLVWEERIKAGRNSMLGMPKITPVQGGLPIVVEGTCIGGVGISGVQSHEDEQIAAAGIKALG
ncbi:GlcG/HbpS family heme-binding protein [Microcoleus sp. OTE_8_concoct_300]|uniref:GlcG/HbpS family heme-binding protein n=1 Tax=Microcoleus sp. OTE_8_concoct_300 TaxID=2964710 RepID=UPI00403F3095